MQGKPLISENGEGQVAILSKGNQTTRHTLEELSNRTKLHKDVVRKSLTFWENEDVIRRIKERNSSQKSKNARTSGRPEDHRRYEMDPSYVWNGPLWAGVALALKQQFEESEIA